MSLTIYFLYICFFPPLVVFVCKHVIIIIILDDREKSSSTAHSVHVALYYILFIFVCNYKIIFSLSHFFFLHFIHFASAFGGVYVHNTLCAYIRKGKKIAIAHTASRHYHWDGLRQWRWATEKLELGFCTRKKIFYFSMFLTCYLTHSLLCVHKRKIATKKWINALSYVEKNRIYTHVHVCHIHYFVYTHNMAYFFLYRKTFWRTCLIVSTYELLILKITFRMNFHMTIMYSLLPLYYFSFIYVRPVVLVT